MSDKPAFHSDRDCLVAAARALGRIDRDGLRGVTMISTNDIEAMAVALVILGLIAIPPEALVAPDQLVIPRNAGVSA